MNNIFAYHTHNLGYKINLFAVTVIELTFTCGLLWLSKKHKFK
jgi:hypothetical protein